MATPPSISRCQYDHVRGPAVLIDALVRQRAAGAWRRPSISSLHDSRCLRLSAQLAHSLWPSIIFHLSYLTCPSLSHASSFPSLPSSTLEHSLEAANHSKSHPYTSILSCSLKYLSPYSFRLPSPPETSEKPRRNLTRDPGGLIEKRWDVLASFFANQPSLAYMHQIHPSYPPTSVSHLSGVCILSAQSGCYVWGSGTNMGNKLQNEMLLLMCKHSLWQHGVSTHPHTHCTTACMLAYDTYAWYTSMLQTAHSQHICKD